VKREKEMSEKKAVIDQTAKTEQSGEVRKPYMRPEILSTEALESVANVCSGGGGSFTAKADPALGCATGLLRS
jgi:hypothetical protein